MQQELKKEDCMTYAARIKDGVSAIDETRTNYYTSHRAHAKLIRSDSHRRKRYAYRVHRKSIDRRFPKEPEHSQQVANKTNALN